MTRLLALVVLLTACGDTAPEPSPFPSCLTDGGLLGATADGVLACAGAACSAFATSPDTQTWNYCPGACEPQCDGRVSVHFAGDSVVAISVP